MVLFDAAKFDQVEKFIDKNDPSKGVKPFMGDLPATVDDTAAFKSAMNYYGITNEEDFYNLHDPTLNECNAVFRELIKKFAENPDTNYLILFVFAGHGMNASGQQVLLVNEFDKPSNFYKKLDVEAKIRTMSEACPNTYSLAFFACCREIYDKTRH